MCRGSDEGEKMLGLYKDGGRRYLIQNIVDGEACERV